MSATDANRVEGATAVRRLADWDGARLRALAGEFETPLYVLDLDRVHENATRLLRAFPDADVSYAVKANATRGVLETVRDAGLGAECGSAGEVRRALDAGFPGERVRYTAVNPPARDLDEVVSLSHDHDLVLTVDSVDTFERVADRDFAGRLCVRVNPGVGAGHHAKVTTGDAPQFGVPYDRAAALCAEVRERGFDLVGLHAHAGSGISGEGLAAHAELVRRLSALGREVGDLDFVAVGGGFGVPCRPEDPPLDLDAVAAATREAFDCEARLAIEPGRYVVADAGVLLAATTAVTETPETTVVGCDAGMTTLLRPALYDAYHEVRVLAPDAADRPTARCLVAGPVCETADVLARDRPLPEPAVDDVLAVGNAGAYAYEMASQYNSRPRPAVVSLAGDPLVRRETLADLTRLEH
ncbi:diaminopimelate decarboxylase [Halomarina ordinaria]|uniref:Diaminopimelate decarboxylase n=1 Tax=Halomarina ordinaria TaxID=3033939 RepID=A0ABD5UAY0_9EURY|nr:diaminopimelate decarboxylase [Halomarina sp. PSRA2]